MCNYSCQHSHIFKSCFGVSSAAMWAALWDLAQRNVLCCSCKPLISSPTFCLHLLPMALLVWAFTPTAQIKGPWYADLFGNDHHQLLQDFSSSKSRNTLSNPDVRVIFESPQKSDAAMRMSHLWPQSINQSGGVHDSALTPEAMSRLILLSSNTEHATCQSCIHIHAAFMPDWVHHSNCHSRSRLKD